MRRARLLALLFPLALTVIGPATVAATGHLVRITSRLEPAQLTIAPGDTVTFRNDDDRRHRLRSRTEAGEFDTGDLEPGASFRVRFNASGTFSYIDERDDDDERYWGTIVVGETTAPNPTDSGSGGGGGGAGGGGSTASTAATIRLADRVFSPGSVTIAAGGTVTWRNDDDREHTATATGSEFDSGELAPGETYRKTFESAGTFPFLCVIHPEMQGTVTVTGAAGGGATPRPAATPRAAPTPTPQPTPRAESGDPANVTIVDLDFEPGEVEVPAGSSVTWTNTGVAPHTATADGGTFDSDQIDPGGSFTATFAEPGRFAYFCAIHPSMTGTVIVRASPGGGVGPAPGSTASASPGVLTTAAPASAGPSPGGTDATAPPGGGAARSEGGTGESTGSSSEPFAASLMSTILALGLIVGALMVGTGLVMGTARRGGASGRAG